MRALLHKLLTALVINDTRDRVRKCALLRITGRTGPNGIALNHPTAAEAHFRRAVGLAQAQGAKLFELRATLSLALLGREQRIEKPTELLRPVYDWFTEGFDSADLAEARGLLDNHSGFSRGGVRRATEILPNGP